MSHPGKLRALAATARIANVPSVVSNVFLGHALVHVAGGITTSADYPMLALSGVFLYLAGNFLNDWADHEWDSQRRPERALPRKLFAPSSYLAMAMTFALLGVGSASFINARSMGAAAGIGALIVVYTWLHKRSSWAVIPMGLCRAMLPVLGFSAGFTRHPVIWPISAGVFCYIAGLSLSARCESLENPPSSTRLLATSLLLMPAVLMSSLAYQHIVSWHLALIGLVPYALWLTRCLTTLRKPPQVHVSALLAGIPLVDWILLLPLALATAASAQGWSAFAVSCLAIPPLAFIAGRSLQRLAPAT